MDPTSERRRHSRVRPATGQIADAAGGIGAPWRAETMLERMERLGEITPPQRAAGEDFQRLFHAANMDQLHAASMERPHTTKGARASLTVEPSRRQMTLALDVLGGLGSAGADVCWHVLGCEMSFRDYSMRMSKLRREAAKGALIAALGVLGRHFGR